MAGNRRQRRIRQLMEKYEGKCAYCTAPVERRPVKIEEWRRATIDHDNPLSLGGTWDWENLVLACSRCNQRKGSLTGTEYRALRAAEAARNRPQKPQNCPSGAISASG